MGKFNIRATKMSNRNNATITLDPKMKIVIIPMDDPVCSSHNMSPSKFNNMIYKLKRREDGKGTVTADIACYLDRKTENFQIPDANTIHIKLNDKLSKSEFLAQLEQIIEELLKRLNSGMNQYTTTIITNDRFEHSSSHTVVGNIITNSRVSSKRRSA